MTLQKYDARLDVVKMSNNEMYLNIEQIETLFTIPFDEFLKTLNIGNERASYLKAIQIFDLRGYLTPEDFEKDMILEIDNIKFYSLSYLTLYIVEFDRFLSRQLGCFINQKFL
jgi:hypothetical protein